MNKFELKQVENKIKNHTIKFHKAVDWLGRYTLENTITGMYYYFTAVDEVDQIIERCENE